MANRVRPSPSAPSPWALLEALPGIVRETDATGRPLYVSPQARQLLGHDPAAWTGQERFWERHLHPDDLSLAAGAVTEALDGHGSRRVRYRFRDGSGRYRWVEDAIRVVERDGELRVTGVMLEVPPGAPAADRTATTDTHVEQVLDSLADGVYYVDLRREITYWNQGAERLSGYPAERMVGQRCYANLLAHVDATGRQLCFDGCPLSATMEDGQTRDADVWLRHADGSRRPVRVRTAPVRDAAGCITGGVEVFSDASGLVAARDEAEAARHEALTDALTGLPNRRFLDLTLAVALDELHDRRAAFAFVLLDIDQFKRFNDDHGHATGDEALRVVARTIRGALRNGDVVGRWGGEEFAIVAAGASAEVVSTLAGRVLALVRSAVVRAGSEALPVRVSIGSTLARPGDDAAGLFERADAALYAAKHAGRDRHVTG